MKIIAILLIVVGVVGLFFSTIMYGDIGVACAVGAIASLLSGIEFILIGSKLKKLNDKENL